MKEINKNNDYERMLNVFTVSHQKNKNSIKILMKFKKESAVIENENADYRK